MPVINKGTALSNGEQLTAEKLNDLLDLATFSPTATDNVSTFVNSSGQIVVLDGGIAATKLATNAVTTTKILNANVTKAKLENMSAPLKVLGRTTAGAGAVEEVTILDEDDLVSNSAIALATQQSIKAYVDAGGAFTPTTYVGGESVTLPNGLIMKMGTKTSTGAWTTLSVVFETAFPTLCVNVIACAGSGGTTESTTDYGLSTHNFSVTGFDITARLGARLAPIRWQAFGY